MFLLVPLAFVCAMKNMLTEIIEKCKGKFKPIEDDLILGLVIVSVALIGFGLGRLSKIEEGRTPITVENMGAIALQAGGQGGLEAGEAPFIQGGEKLLVASKNGTKYHYTWCPGAVTIKEANKVFFSSKEEAEAAGYAPAANCKGL